MASLITAPITRMVTANVIHKSSPVMSIIPKRSRGTRGPYKPPVDPPHPETPEFPGEMDPDWPPLGRIYDKKPWKIALTEGKTYYWCSCGTSKNQPFCDGSHKTLDTTAPKKTVPKHRPIRFKVEESKDFWLCNCKQTGNRPFCDGTHKRQDIQDAIRG